MSVTPADDTLSASQQSGAFDASASGTAAGSRSGSTAEIVDMVHSLNVTLDSAIGEINQINTRTKLLALNARIEAARAGSYGASFGVVASEMQKLAANTSQAANQLATKTRPTIEKLLDVIGMTVRGNRLSDMALVNIDLIDRNLYERSCDVRWWATDSSVVDALTQRTPESLFFASSRLGTILNSYTVYWDIVLADTKGRIVANGRPDRYRSVESNVSGSDWFEGALATSSGEQFAFESAHLSNLVGRQPALIYSAAVREGGQARGEPLGVLGIIFNWAALAESVFKITPVAEVDRARTRMAIIDLQGRIMADSTGREINDLLPSAWLNAISSRKGFTQIDAHGQAHCLAFADSPGFETYATGWRSIILQPL